MIHLRLKFASKDEPTKDFDIVDAELLSAAVDRAIDGVPLGALKAGEVFQTTVNGLHIHADLWPVTALKPTDTVLVSPRIKSGDSGQMFKQFLIVVITAVASYYLGPAGAGLTGAAFGVGVAAITIGATLLLNALIPPPVPKTGDIALDGGLESSQMYAFSGQSNQMKRLQTVLKVYGTHRVFPNVAAVPYTELDVDPLTGETIQYLYAIYDFGLGTMIIDDLLIGDTPLITDSFADFQYNLVDINRPTLGSGNDDKWDQQLKNEFQYYKGRREITPLSVVLTDGVPTTQNSDPNPDLEPQEIVVDIVANRGLYSFSSNGDLGTRSVRIELHFALVGSTDFHPYNDLDFVDSYKSTGGSDLTEFEVQLVPTITEPGQDEFYAAAMFSRGYSNSFSSIRQNNILTVGILPGGRKLLVVDRQTFNGVDSDFLVGQKIFYGNRLLGVIETVENYVPNSAYTVITLDRAMTQNFWGSDSFDINAYKVRGTVSKDIDGHRVYDWSGPVYDVLSIRSSGHESGIAVMTGNSTSPVYANFRFKPKVAGQYQVRVKRVNAFGPYSTQTSDEVTWGAITTALISTPIHTTKRHVFMEIRIKATDQLNGAISTLSGVASSVLPVYDPDTQTWVRDVTSNPAWIFADMMTGEVNKRPISVDKLHLPSLVEWANYCDAIVAGPDGDMNDPRFTCNFVLDYAVTLQDLLNQVGGSSQASLNLIDGKYGVLIDRFKDTPVQVFTPRNSKGFTSSRMYAARPHGVKIKYIDPNRAWEVSETIAYDNGYSELNATDLDDLTAFGCTSSEQAWRFGRYMIAQNRLRQESISILVDFEHLVCTRGDYVQISQDVMRSGGTPARVKSTNYGPVSPEYYENISTGIVGGGGFSIYANKLVVASAIAVTDVSIRIRNFGGATGQFTMKVLGILAGEPDETNVIDSVSIPATPVPGSFSDVNFEFATPLHLEPGTYFFSLDAADDDNAALAIEVYNAPNIGYTSANGGATWSNVQGYGMRVNIDNNNYVTIDDAIDVLGGVDYGYTFRSAVDGVLTSTMTPITPHTFRIDGELPAVGDLIIVGAVGQIVLDCIVKTISPNDDTSASLLLVEKADAIFDYESTGELPEYDPQISSTSFPDIRPPLAVQNLAVADNFYECAMTKSGYAYYVDLVWDMPFGSVFEQFEIYVNDGRGYRFFETTTSKIYRYEVDQARLDKEHGFKVVAVSATGKKLQLIAMTTVLATPASKITPPSDVEDFSMSITNQILQLAWSAIDDCDAFQYVLRYSPDNNDVWESSIPLVTVSKNVTSVSVQARTGVYFIKAIDFAGNESASPAVALTTIPNLFDLNIIEEMNEAPTFTGSFDLIELLGEAVILQEEVPGDINSVRYYSVGYYEFAELLDLGDIYSVRLQSLIRADGLKKGELMSEWEHLEDIDHLNTAIHSDWNAALQYRATESFASMADWEELQLVDHINLGAGVGFTDWRDIPTTGDATGRIFQFRTRLESFAANVTPRVFDTTVKADMPDRTDSFENQISSASEVTAIVYDPVFKGPGTSPNIQISIDNGASGDYWTFDYKTLEGFGIRFYNSSNIQVVRQFDVVAKGYGRRHTATL